MKNYKRAFPIFKKNKGLIYLDSAATSQKPQKVVDAISNYYKSSNANIHRGLYPLSEKATQMVDGVRKKVAKFINAKDVSEIIFVRNTTEAINLVAYAWGRKNIQKGDTVVTTIMEHHSNFVPWQVLAKEKNATFKTLDINYRGELLWENGRCLPAGKAGKMKNGKLLTLTHVSNVLGTINPIKKIIQGVKIKNPKIKVLVDGAQSVPHMKVDVQDLDCDFFAFSGHKMMASTGIGVLYVKKELLAEMDPFLFGGDMIKEVTLEKTTFADPPQKFEAGTLDIAGIISLGAAIEYINYTGIENIQKHEIVLTRYCLRRMGNIGGIKVYGSSNIENRVGVISFNLEEIHAHDVAQILASDGVCVRSGHQCAMPLHKRLGIPATIRASFYLYNNKEDIDRLIEGIKEVKKIFKA